MAHEPTLLAGEKVVSIRDVDVSVTERLGVAEAMCRLTGVGSKAEIGDAGPVHAASTAHPAAGRELRLFEAVFGRDSLISAMFVIDRFPKLLPATIRLLAELQGIGVRRAAEEEPGRIVHEARSPDDPVAQRLTRRGGWEWPYYGSIDATPLFVLGCKALTDRRGEILREKVTRRDGRAVTIAQCCADALRWIVRRAELAPTGLIETRPALETGLAIQSWKDSWDAYCHASGEVAVAPLSSAEVQGYAYDALAFGPELQEFHPSVLSPAELGAIAAARQQIAVSFRSLYVLDAADGPPIAAGADYGPDGAPRPIIEGASNMGHLLRSSLLDELAVDGLAERIVGYLMSDEMLAGAGIRTVATTAPRYRETAYHNGSVWLWDSAFIALGLHERGLANDASNLADRIGAACARFGAYPEFARGSAEISFNTRVVDIEDAGGRRNRIEQPPQQVQAWTVAGLAALQYAGLVPERR